MEFDHYEEAPSHIQQKIIAEAVKEGGSGRKKRNNTGCSCGG